MSSFQEKIKISAFSAILFALVNLPATYQFTNNLTKHTLYDNNINCPTDLGLIIHALVFFIITLLTMGNITKNTGIKLKHSLYGTLIFYLISSPAAFSLTNSLFGNEIATDGCPTITGIVLHTFIYFAALFAVMYLPDRDY